MEMETICDAGKSTVSTKTTHFSKYMIVDRTEWFAAWSVKLDYTGDKTLDTVFVVDCSLSMVDNDPIINIPRPSCGRISAIQTYISTMENNERGAIVKFGYDVTAGSSDLPDPDGDGVETIGMLTKTQLSNEVYTINNSMSGTDFGTAIAKGLDLIRADYKSTTKIIIFMSDGNDFGDSDNLSKQLNRAQDLGVKIYTVGFGSDCDAAALKSIAEKTGGEYLTAATAGELRDAYEILGVVSKVDLEKDDDKDGLPDVFEYTEIRMSNGRYWNKYTGDVIYCNPNNSDTDGDGLLDGEEITYQVVPHIFNGPIPYDKFGTSCYIKFRVHSYPNEIDSDGDGLLDCAKIINENGVNIAPIDNTPFTYTGPKNLWKTHTSIDLTEKIPSELGEWFEYKTEYNLAVRTLIGPLYDRLWLIYQVRNGINSPVFTAAGSRFLNFRMDTMNEALHSEVKTWQKFFGYNNLYDWGFALGTNNNMEPKQFWFKYNNEQYVLWIWRGDYLNLGGGAEMGIYKTITVPWAQGYHWDAVDFELPMTLSLYDYSKHSENPDTIFRWTPKDDQWWITGFKPDFTNPQKDKMAIVGSIDFSKFTDNYGYNEMYESFKSENIKNNGKTLIFDDDTKTIWIMWWGDNVR